MEWKTVKLGDCLSKIIDNRGKTPKDLAVSGHPLLEINAVTKNNKYPLYKEAKKYVDDSIYSTWFRSGHPRYGDILVPTVGTLGAVAFVDRNDCCIAQNLIALRVNEKISDSAYIYYMLCNPLIVKKLLNLDIGAVQASIKVPHLLALELPLPPLDTQRRIAAILSSLDDKIENNNRINRNLEAQAQALYKSWFVDFEPWGGTMPEDWREGTLGDIAHVTSGKRPPLKESLRSAEVNIPLIGAADIMGYTNTALYSTPILVTGRVGTHGIVQRFDEPCWPSDNTLVVEGSWYEYIYQTMNRIDYHNMNRGSTQPLITQTDLKCQRVIIPSQSILDKFEIHAGLIFKRILNNKRENDRLAALRDTLLPKLMKGEIAVA